MRFWSGPARFLQVQGVQKRYKKGFKYQGFGKVPVRFPSSARQEFLEGCRDFLEGCQQASRRFIQEFVEVL